jgi:Leucine rich repeat
LECDYSTVPYGFGPFWNPTNEQQCTVKNFVVWTTSQVVTHVNQQNSTFYQDKPVTKLYIKSQIVHFFPEGIDNFFPSVNELQIINSSLKTIDKYDLMAFTNLEFLNLPYNSLEVLRNDLFVFNPKLRYIYLNNNNLKFIGENVFDVLKATNFLASLELNYCTNFFFHNREGTNNFPEFKGEVRSRCKVDSVLRNVG